MVVCLLLQTHSLLSQALEQDPTVFDYDSVYDTLQEQKELACQKTWQSRDTKVVALLLHVLCFSFELSCSIYVT